MLTETDRYCISHPTLSLIFTPLSLSFAVFFFFSLYPLKIVESISTTQNHPPENLRIEESYHYMSSVNKDALKKQIALPPKFAGKFVRLYQDHTKMIYVFQFERHIALSSLSGGVVNDLVVTRGGLKITHDLSYVSAEEVSSVLVADEREQKMARKARAEGWAEARDKTWAEAIDAANVVIARVEAGAKAILQSKGCEPDLVSAERLAPSQFPSSSQSSSLPSTSLDQASFVLNTEEVLRTKLVEVLASKVSTLALTCDSEYTLGTKLTPFSGRLDIALRACGAAANLYLSGDEEDNDIRAAAVELKRGPHHGRSVELQCVCGAFALLVSEIEAQLKNGSVPTEMLGWGISLTRNGGRCYELRSIFNGKCLMVMYDSTPFVHQLASYFNFVMKALLRE